MLELMCGYWRFCNYWYCCSSEGMPGPEMIDLERADGRRAAMADVMNTADCNLKTPGFVDYKSQKTMMI